MNKWRPIADFNIPDGAPVDFEIGPVDVWVKCVGRERRIANVYRNKDGWWCADPEGEADPGNLDYLSDKITHFMIVNPPEDK